MGSVAKMRLLRAVVLAVVVAVALAGSGGPTFSVKPSSAPAQVAKPLPFGAADSDPSDPGLPPD